MDSNEGGQQEFSHTLADSKEKGVDEFFHAFGKREQVLSSDTPTLHKGHYQIS